MKKSYCNHSNAQSCKKYVTIIHLNTRVVESSQLTAKIAAYLVSIGRLLCLAFLYGWHFLNKIYPDWLLTLTTKLFTSKLSDNPA